MSSSVDWRVVTETRDRLGEGALWSSHEGALWWIDFYGPTIRRLDPATRAIRSWVLSGAGTIGSIAFAGEGRLLVAIDGGVHLFDTRDEARILWSDPNGGRPGIGYNDAKVDRFGRYWIGTFDVAEVSPRGILYRLDPGGGFIVGDSGFAVCNGPAFGPDGRTMYFSDSMGRRVLAYDIDGSDRPPSLPRVFAEISEGFPDGLCVATDGSVYCALYGGGGVLQFGPDGQVLRKISLPVRNVTSCCLGGASLQTLYITTADDGGNSALDGALFAVEVSVPGLPEPVFNPDIPAG